MVSKIAKQDCKIQDFQLVPFYSHFWYFLQISHMMVSRSLVVHGPWQAVFCPLISHCHIQPFHSATPPLCKHLTPTHPRPPLLSLVHWPFGVTLAPGTCFTAFLYSQSLPSSWDTQTLWYLRLLFFSFPYPQIAMLIILWDSTLCSSLDLLPQSWKPLFDPGLFFLPFCCFLTSNERALCSHSGC